MSIFKKILNTKLNIEKDRTSVENYMKAFNDYYSSNAVSGIETVVINEEGKEESFEEYLNEALEFIRNNR